MFRYWVPYHRQVEIVWWYQGGGVDGGDQVGVQVWSDTIGSSRLVDGKEAGGDGTHA
jgi:hypothetical protein